MDSVHKHSEELPILSEVGISVSGLISQTNEHIQTTTGENHIFIQIKLSAVKIKQKRIAGIFVTF